LKVLNKTEQESLARTIDEETPIAPVDDGGSGERSGEAVIGHGLKITGNLDCDGDIVIAGTVEGDITSRGLTVVKDATVKGTIRSEMVHVIGEVEGQIDASSIRIAKSGLVAGEIHYDALGVEDGATIDGHLRHKQYGPGGT
jgi:cytoskeletal protein CcmA (bactofilin family)